MTPPAGHAGPEPSTAAKLTLLGTLYLSQGLPFGFFTQTVPALMRDAGYSLAAIGLSSMLMLPWALKPLWAPLVDRYHHPRVGRRRSWILPLQALAILLMLALAGVDPAAGLMPLVVGMALVSLISATQDIATDGLAVDLLRPQERGAGNGVQVAGYRGGMVIGGGLLLMLHPRLGLTGIYLAMAVLLLGASVPILRHREAPAAPTAPADYLTGALGALWQPGMLRWLGLIVVWKAGDAMAGPMVTPFFKDLGLELADIGRLKGVLGSAAALVGALAGGWATGRLGRRQALVLFGLLQVVGNASYLLPALGHRWALPGAIVAESLLGSAATAALFTAMMDRCRSDHGATDYTLQATVIVVTQGVVGPLAGGVADALGWVGFFCATAVAGVVGLALLGWAWPPSPLDVHSSEDRA